MTGRRDDDRPLMGCRADPLSVTYRNEARASDRRSAAGAMCAVREDLMAPTSIARVVVTGLTRRRVKRMRTNGPGRPPNKQRVRTVVRKGARLVAHFRPGAGVNRDLAADAVAVAQTSPGRQAELRRGPRKSPGCSSSSSAPLNYVCLPSCSGVMRILLLPATLRKRGRQVGDCRSALGG